MWVLAIETRFSGRAASALNPRAVSPPCNLELVGAGETAKVSLIDGLFLVCSHKEFDGSFVPAPFLEFSFSEISEKFQVNHLFNTLNRSTKVAKYMNTFGFLSFLQ